MNIDVSANGFFILAPVFIIIIFLYLQIYLRRQKELVKDLKRQYGHLEERRLYPWIVNIADSSSSGCMGELEKFIVALCIWVAPIVVLNVLFLSYIRKHAPVMTYVVASLALLGAVVVVFSWWTGGTKRSGWRRPATRLAVCLVIAL